MTKQLIFIFVVLCSLQAHASVQSAQGDTIQPPTFYNVTERLQSMQPVYLDGVVLPMSRTGNWFVSIAGGTTRISRYATRLRRPFRTPKTLVQPCRRQMVHAIGRCAYQLQRFAVQGWCIVQTGLPPYPCGFAMECTRSQVCPTRSSALESCTFCRNRTPA